METIRVKSTHPKSQGDFVVMNKDDFDPAVHELYAVAAEAEVKREVEPAAEDPVATSEGDAQKKRGRR